MLQSLKLRLKYQRLSVNRSGYWSNFNNYDVSVLESETVLDVFLTASNFRKHLPIRAANLWFMQIKMCFYICWKENYIIQILDVINPDNIKEEPSPWRSRESERRRKKERHNASCVFWQFSFCLKWKFRVFEGLQWIGRPVGAKQLSVHQ